jgi:lactoylglutathione lyase
VSRFLTSLSPGRAGLPTHTGPHTTHTVGPRDRLLSVGMTLRIEIFTADLDAVVAFYTGVLDFMLVRDERSAPVGYVAVERGAVRIGAAYRPDTVDPALRHPPTGIELVLEVDDLQVEHDRVVAAGWPLEGALEDRPWGLTDFRILDPAGHYLRITNRSAG